jgi:hypothetical protein
MLTEKEVIFAGLEGRYKDFCLHRNDYSTGRMPNYGQGQFLKRVFSDGHFTPEGD